MSTQHDIVAALQWHIDMGCDESIGDVPINRLQPPPVVADAAASVPGPAPQSGDVDVPPPPSRSTATTSRGAPTTPREVDGDLQLKTAVELAQGAQTIAELRTCLETFEGCALKKTATNMVLADGPADAKLMFVGEAPGAEEDRQGVPFVGPSGLLLNKILESVGLSRDAVLISNTVFWRPPGNRTPTTLEAAVCKPFIERLVEIVDPAVLICVGAPAAHTMLGETQGISRLRGKWYTFQTPNIAHPIAATAMFHPAYLLRTPIKKREAWHDIRMIKAKLDETTG